MPHVGRRPFHQQDTNRTPDVKTRVIGCQAGARIGSFARGAVMPRYGTSLHSSIRRFVRQRDSALNVEVGAGGRGGVVEGGGDCCGGHGDGCLFVVERCGTSLSRTVFGEGFEHFE